jgi:hypothetical protein
MLTFADLLEIFLKTTFSSNGTLEIESIALLQKNALQHNGYPCLTISNNVSHTPERFRSEIKDFLLSLSC